MKPRSETPKDEGPWAWQARDAAARAGQIGINAYAIYCALTHFQSAAGLDQKRRFPASYEQVAEHVGCSRGTVAEALSDLQEAGLIRKFSGSNGAKRATRNAFFLTSISSTPHGRGSTPHERHVSPRGERHVSTPHGRNKEKEQLDRAASSGSGSNKEEREESTRSPLTGGGGPLENGVMPEVKLTAEQIEEGRRLAAFRDSL
jgi:DNA-binding Lrp family transcriptional regulator